MGNEKIKAAIAGIALWSSVVSFGSLVSLLIDAPDAMAIQRDLIALKPIERTTNIFKFEKFLDTVDYSSPVNDSLQPSKTYLYQGAGVIGAKYLKNTQVVLPKEIYIPKLKKRLPLLNPKTTDINKLDALLKKGVLRYVGTGTLKESSRNMLVFGHSSHLPFVRNKMYKAFNYVETLKPGDVIELTGEDNQKYIYKVKYVKLAKASTEQVNIDTAKKTLTLITCNVLAAKEDRWIVVAEAI